MITLFLSIAFALPNGMWIADINNWKSCIPTPLYKSELVCSRDTGKLCIAFDPTIHTRTCSWDLEAEQLRQEIQAAKAAYRRVNAIDFDTATTAEMRAALKDMWLIQQGTVKHLRN